MEFESEQQAIELLKENQKVPEHIKDGRDSHAELKALIKGDGFKALLIECIEFLESEKRKLAREKYARSIKDMNKRLLRGLDNVYNATGGSKEYFKQFKLGDKQKELFLKNISKVRDNKSVESYLESNWVEDGYHVDPMGLQFMEYKTKDINGNKLVEPKAWPTYKSINDIRNYEPRGQNIEWVIFEGIKVEDLPKKIKELFPNVNKAAELIRVVDDVKDYRFLKNNDEYTLVELLTFDHPFRKCPGIVNSNLRKIGTNIYLSPLDDVVELEKELLRDQSIKTIFKFQHGISIFWRLKMECPECKGFGKKGVNDCPNCDGQGWAKDKSDVTTEVIMPVPRTSEDINLEGNIAGHITPDLEIWDQYIKEGELLEVQAFQTYWGSHKSKVDSNVEKTAFEVWINSQPVMSKLNKISSVAEFMEWQITEWLGNFYIPAKPLDKTIANINYGRNYIIQPLEFILEEYKKSESMTTVIRDRQLREIITTKNRYNPEQLQIEIKKVSIEPYTHYKVDTVVKVFGQEEGQRKILFNEWWLSIERGDKINLEEDKLREDFKTWFEENKVKIKEPTNIVPQPQNN